MKRTLWKRIFRSGMTLVRRNGFLGISSIAVMVVTLTVVLGLIFAQALLDTTIKTIESRIDVTISIAENVSDDTISQMQRELESMPEVKNVQYISKEEGLVQFRERHNADDVLLSAIDEVNKNPIPATFVIHARDTSQYEGIINKLQDDATFLQENKSFITKVNFGRNKDVIDKVVVLRDGVRKFGLALTFIFIIIAVLVTFNTVRLSVYTMRDEIEIMRLVGASSMYVRGPFVVAQGVYSLIASVFTLFIFLGITYSLRDSLRIFFGVDLFNYYIANSVQIAIIIIGSGLILGTIASSVAVGRYLRK